MAVAFAVSLAQRGGWREQTEPGRPDVRSWMLRSVTGVEEERRRCSSFCRETRRAEAGNKRFIPTVASRRETAPENLV